MSHIVQKLWGFCHTLRHDGVDYGDYIEQLTYLLFLKMADERRAKVPKDCDWESLKPKSGTQLTDHSADSERGSATRSAWGDAADEPAREDACLTDSQAAAAHRAALRPSPNGGVEQ